MLLVLSETCKDGRAGRAIEKMWDKILHSRLIKIKLTDEPGTLLISDVVTYQYILLYSATWDCCSSVFLLYSHGAIKSLYEL